VSHSGRPTTDKAPQFDGHRWLHADRSGHGHVNLRVARSALFSIVVDARPVRVAEWSYIGAWGTVRPMSLLISGIAVPARRVPVPPLIPLSVIGFASAFWRSSSHTDVYFEGVRSPCGQPALKEATGHLGPVYHMSPAV
jgi:hypothetical protein